MRVTISTGLVILLVLTAVKATAFEDPELLAEKRVELEERERTVKRREERLQEMLDTLDKKIGEFRDLRTSIEAYLKAIEKIHNEELIHLVKTYEAMPQEEAAQRLEKLDRSLATEILSRMKAKSAGRVMALMKPAVVASLSKRMAQRGDKVIRKK